MKYKFFNLHINFLYKSIPEKLKSKNQKHLAIKKPEFLKLMEEKKITYKTIGNFLSKLVTA